MMTTSRSEFAKELEGDGPFGPPSHGTPTAPAPSRDAELVALYWDTYDKVLAGLKTRLVKDGFPGTEVAAMTATLFIARSKG